MDWPSHIARYAVVRPLARGGTGEVFLAHDGPRGRLVALKLLQPQAGDGGRAERFEAVARRVATLSHPHLVTIHEVGWHDGRPYVAMEYVVGHSVAAIITHRMPFPTARRLRWIEDTCAGLAHAHRAGLVHHDVKPANLMVTTSGLVKVIDFGNPAATSPRRTVAGTPNYLSPEQIIGHPVDHRSDVFAVGAVLYEVLTGVRAFGGDPATAMGAIVRGCPAPLESRCPDLPPDAQHIVDTCLAKSPDDRYQDLTALGHDLARLRSQLPST